MNKKKQLKLFISYSHLDEDYIEQFRKHISPLKINGFIEDWYDRKIIAGQEFQNHINNNLDDADVICLFISANFLSSMACIKEKKNALKLKKQNGIAVVPIILSACGWIDDMEISQLLALPTDGSPVAEYSNPDRAWLTVYEGIKSAVEQEYKIRQLDITEQTKNFLESTELLAKSHSQKNIVLLEDIFVNPELAKFDDLREYESKVNLSELIEDIFEYPNILIAGENQSGKTTICKKIFIALREKKYIPIYIRVENNRDIGKIENRILTAFKEQYIGLPIEEIDKHRIIPIIDDFYFAKNKEKLISNLSSYSHQIVMVDDIFSLNIKDDTILKTFTHFRILEFSPSLRNQIINKWTHLTDKKNGFGSDENKIYENIDNTTELVNAALGKAFGSGIMPAYPFFILSVINIYQTYGRPLDQEITSQGYCYQALIYMHLRKQGVQNDEIDTYINFLTEFSFYFYTGKKINFQKMNLIAFLSLTMTNIIYLSIQRIS
ncbi:MAG: TIR domain-containing protein [Smithellaceae bacterium]